MGAVLCQSAGKCTWDERVNSVGAVLCQSAGKCTWDERVNIVGASNLTPNAQLS